MGTEKSPLPFQVVENDDGVDLFETQLGHGYLYHHHHHHHPVKVENIRDLLVRRGFTKTCQIIGGQGLYRKEMRKKKRNRNMSKRRRNYKINAGF
jgi:hypothetical protein